MHGGRLCARTRPGSAYTPEPRVNLGALFHILQEAGKLSGHNDFVVIGSLSILGLEADFDVPHDMTMSNDVDCYTRDDPDRIFELVGARLKKLFGRRRSPTELDETQALQRHRDREAARQRRI